MTNKPDRGREAEALTAAYMDACRDRSGDWNEIGYWYFRKAWNAAIAHERAECAKVCEARYMGDNNREDAEAKRCAAAIRARAKENRE